MSCKTIFNFSLFCPSRWLAEMSMTPVNFVHIKKRHGYALSLCYLYHFISIHQIFHFLHRNIQLLCNRFRSFPTHESLKNLFGKFFTVFAFPLVVQPSALREFLLVCLPLFLLPEVLFHVVPHQIHTSTYDTPPPCSLAKTLFLFRYSIRNKVSL